jgi:hypothetical protein
VERVVAVADSRPREDEFFIYDGKFNAVYMQMEERGF